MKSHLIGAIVAAAVSFAAAGAIAQTAVTIAPADQSKLTAWIGEQKVTEATVPSGFNVAVGAVVPQTVTLYEIPASVGVTSVTKYRYVKLGGKVVLVDPSDRKIVQILG